MDGLESAGAVAGGDRGSRGLWGRVGGRGALYGAGLVRGADCAVGGGVWGGYGELCWVLLGGACVSAVEVVGVEAVWEVEWGGVVFGDTVVVLFFGGWRAGEACDGVCAGFLFWTCVLFGYI